MSTCAKKSVKDVLAGLCLGFFSHGALADGTVIDKVYHPYVEPLEWELEWRMIHQDEDRVTGEQRAQTHRLGFGKAIAETVFAEIYLIGEQNSDTSFSTEAYEVEILWQLSEQGELFLDWALLFEFERESDIDIWEYSTAVLLEKEFGRFSATANLGLVYEWGSDIDNEVETFLALQTRYRYSPRFEPALELYLGQDTRGIGPVITGAERLGNRKALRWEAGVILGFDKDTADYTLRAVLEYEF
ncbi:MAG: hypothetical protein ACJAUG_001522 [Halioglobus sp.]|jgi:hypothetical protein